MAGGKSTRKPFLTLPGRPLNEKYLCFDPPRNEQEVVWTFALVAESLGFKVESVQGPFPDCIARWGPRNRLVRIEFELRSKHFETHRHPAADCDLVVCWKHDWAGIPPGLQVLELRKYFGKARDVFVVSYRDEYWRRLPDNRESTSLWSVPSRSGVGDLLLVYRPGGPHHEGAITDAFEVYSSVERVDSPGPWAAEDWMAPIRRVARLGSPIPYSRMREMGINGGIESRPRRTDQWPAILREIERKGRPSHSLARFANLP